MELIDGKDLGAVLNARTGLIIGPGASLYPGVFREFVASVGAPGVDIPLVSQANTNDHFNARLKSFLADKSPGVGVKELGAVPWTAILSLSPDSYLEEAIIAQQTGRLRTRTVDVLDEDLRRPPTARAMPCYRLMGNATSSSYSLTQVQYFKRKAQWQAAIHGFRDATKAGPVVCLGLAELPAVMLDLFSYFLGDRLGPPSKLVFLHDDPLVSNRGLEELVSGHTAVFKAHATLGELVRVVRERFIVKAGQTPAANADELHWPIIELSSFSHLAISVNKEAATKTTEKNSNRALDLLFSPDVPAWEPFLLDMDLRRELEAEMVDELVEYIEGNRLFPASAVLVGSSATGKTTMLKRVSLQMARKGYAALWMVPSLHPDNVATLKEMFKRIGAARNKRKEPVVVFVDDVYSHGHGFARQIALAAEQASVPVIIVIALRASEWDGRNAAEISGGAVSISTWHLDDSLTEEEWRRLPSQIHKIGLAMTLESAEERVAAAESKHARDTLAVLWALAPKARGPIKSAIRGEYVRLGSPRTLSSVVANLSALASEPLRRAYEIVAVCSSYGVPVPVEVLVSALGIDYATWLQEASPTGPAWGLLYPVENEDAAVYRTRNSVVEETVLETLNGGALGHSGEVRVLGDVLSKCDGNGIVYREFAVRVVTSQQFQRLGFEDGLGLIETICSTLPFPDKTLVHQKGIWIRRKGKNPSEAKRVLLEALATENYPNAMRGEANEHIYTSLAASVVDEVKRRQVDARAARKEIFEYLTKARSDRFFNPNAVHVAATAVREYIQQLGGEAPADSLQLANHVLSDIDATLLVYGVARSPLHESDAAMLGDARDRLVTVVVGAVELERVAEEVWASSSSQEGFAMLIRKLFYDAMRTKKGSDFKEAWERSVAIVDRIEAARRTPLPNIARSMAHLLYQWRVKGMVPGQADLKAEWPRIDGLAKAALRGVPAGSDPATRYVYGLALAHQGKWADARGAFSEIKGGGVPTPLFVAARDYLVYDTGARKKIQGVVRAGAREDFLECREPRWDFVLTRKDAWPPPGNEAFGFVRFSYSGIFMVRDNEV